VLHNCSTIGLQQYRITCGVAHRSTSWSRATGHERSPLELLDLAVGDVQVGAQARYLRAQTTDLSLVRQPHFVTFAAFPLVKAVYLLES